MIIQSIHFFKILCKFVDLNAYAKRYCYLFFCDLIVCVYCLVLIIGLCSAKMRLFCAAQYLIVFAAFFDDVFP